MGETMNCPLLWSICTIFLFDSNLPHGGGFLILDDKFAVSGTATSRTGRVGRIGA